MFIHNLAFHLAATCLLHMTGPIYRKSFWIKIESHLYHESSFHPLCLIRDKSTQINSMPWLNSSEAKPRVSYRILACYSYEIIKTFRFLVRDSVFLVIVAWQIGNYEQLFITVLPWTTFPTVALSLYIYIYIYIYNHLQYWLL